MTVQSPDDGQTGSARSLDDLGERLSRLADGDLSAHEADELLVVLRADAAAGRVARASWHAMHLTGDALRSSDLCGAVRTGFAERFSARLAAEPPLMAPSPLVTATVAAAASRPVEVEQALADAVERRKATGQGWRWASGFAGIAAVAVLAGLTGFNLGGGASSDGAILAQGGGGSAAARGVALVSTDGALANGAALSPAQQAVQRMEASAGARIDPATGLAAIPTNTGVVLRDPALDAQIAELMNAHRQFGGAAALGVPSGFARSAMADGVTAAPR